MNFKKKVFLKTVQIKFEINAFTQNVKGSLTCKCE